VAGADARTVDSGGVALAWGDPPITVRCALPAPARLQPGSRCDTVEGVDWFTERGEEGYRFSTIGRATTVELFVPYEYEPAADALVDMAATVRETVPFVNPCR